MRYILLFLFISSSILKAQDPASIYYTTRDGLISNNIYYVMQDSKGYIWICTDVGVSRFDGKNFKNFGKKEGMDGGAVFICTEDSQGRMWFGSSDNNIRYIENKVIGQYEFNVELKSKIPDNCVKTSIHYNCKTNELILGTLRFGYFHFDSTGNEISNSIITGKTIQSIDSVFINYSLRSNVPPHANSVGFNFVSENDVVSETGDLLPINKKRKPNFYFSIDYLDTAIYVSSHNNVYKYKDGKIELIKIFNEAVDCIYVTGEDIILGSIGDGVKIYSKDFKTKKRKFFGNSTITHVNKDASGRYYFGTLGEGLIYVPSLNVYQYSIRDVSIYGIEELQKGRLYISYIDGSIYEFSRRNKEFKLRFKPDIERAYNPIFFGVDFFESIYISKEYESESQWRGLNYISFENNSLVPRIFEPLDSNRFLVGTYFRLSIFEKKLSREKYLDFSVLDPFLKFRSVDQNSNGHVFIASNRGLFELIDDSIRKVDNIDFDLAKIIQSENSSLLLTIDNNAYILYHHTRELQKVNVNNVTSIGKVNNTNYYYLYGSDGVFLKSVNDKRLLRLNMLKEFKIDEIHLISKYDESLWIINQNSFLEIRDMQLSNGFLRYFPPLVNDVIIEGESVINNENIYAISSKENSSIEFEIGTINHYSSQETGFQYKLEPLHKEWKLSTTPFIKFSNLEQGNYKLVLKNNFNGISFGRSKVVSFSVNTPLWNFSLLYFFLVVLIIIGLYLLKKLLTYNNKRLANEKLNNLEETNLLKLKMLFAQMNPHFTFNILNSLQGLILRENKTDTLYFIGKYARMIRNVLSSSNDPYITISEELELLKRYVEMESLRFSNKIEFEIEILELNDMNNIKIPAMLLQPIIENSIKHGIKNTETDHLKINLSMARKNGFVDIILKDNGVGYSVTLKEKNSENHKSFGMKIVKERLHIINNEYGISDFYNISDLYEDNKISGTIVNLKFPIITNN